MSHPCLNLTARDFDAYLAEKATSNAYSRPRLEVKQRALAWGRSVVERLAEVGIAADMHGSDEHPSLRNKKRVDCQWVFFWRDQDARAELDRLLEQGRSISAAIDDPSPYTRHAFLALRIDAEAVEVCFAVHPDAKVDVDNLRARLATADGKPGEGTLAAEFTAALRALPEEFQIGLRREDRAACSAATPETIVGMLERAAAGQTPLWIGWTVPRETAIAHSTLLDEQLGDAIVALAPIYRLVAWSRENDHIALDTRIEGLEQAKARTHAEVTAQNERWRAEQAALRERSQKQALSRVEEEAPRRPAAGFRGPPDKARRPSLDTLFKPQRGAGGGASKPDGQAGKHDGKHDVQTGKPDARAERQGAHGSRQGAHGTKPDAQSGGGDSGGSAKQSAGGAGGERGERGERVRASGQAGQADQPPAEPRDTQGSSGAPAGPLVIEKGTRVRVLTGAFADKVGTVSELDGRGGARVLLGLLSTRLDLDALEAVPEGRDRPALQSSQRRAASPAAPSHPAQPPQPAQPPRKTR